MFRFPACLSTSSFWESEYGITVITAFFLLIFENTGRLSRELNPLITTDSSIFKSKKALHEINTEIDS